MKKADRLSTLTLISRRGNEVAKSTKERLGEWRKRCVADPRMPAEEAAIQKALDTRFDAFCCVDRSKAEMAASK